MIVAKILAAFFLLAAVLVSVTILPATGHSGNVFIIPDATVPVRMDGVLNTVEWSDASVVSTHVSPNQLGRFITLAKFDRSTGWLYFGFHLDDQTPANTDRVSVGFDTNHDGGSAPMPDDFYLAIGRSSTKVSDGWVGVFCWEGNGTGYQPLDCSSFPYPYSWARSVRYSDWSVELRIQMAPGDSGLHISQTDAACNDCPESDVGFNRQVPLSWADIRPGIPGDNVDMQLQGEGLQLQISELSEKNQELLAELSVLGETNSAREYELVLAQEEVAALLDKLTDQESELNSLRIGISKLEDENSDLRAQTPGSMVTAIYVGIAVGISVLGIVIGSRLRKRR